MSSQLSSTHEKVTGETIDLEECSLILAKRASRPEGIDRPKVRWGSKSTRDKEREIRSSRSSTANAAV